MRKLTIVNLDDNDKNKCLLKQLEIISEILSDDRIIITNKPKRFYEKIEKYATTNIDEFLYLYTLCRQDMLYKYNKNNQLIDENFVIDYIFYLFNILISDRITI